MPRALVLQITCDYPECEEDVETETQARLSLGRREVLLDLCEEHKEELRNFLDPFLKNGQRPPKAERAERRGGGRPPTPPATGDGEVCPLDNNVYKDKESLRKHADRVHGLTMTELLAGEEPRKRPEAQPVDAAHPLECPECHNGFAKPQGLAAHRRITHGVRGRTAA